MPKADTIRERCRCDIYDQVWRSQSFVNKIKYYQLHTCKVWVPTHDQAKYFKVRSERFTYCFHYGQQIERKRLVEILYSGKQRIKQQRITYIISIMNCNDCWNIMAPKEKIMLSSLQKSEKGESLLPVKYMSMKGVSEGWKSLYWNNSSLK